MPKAVLGTRPDALGTVFGRPNVAPKPILGCPGRAKSGQEPSKSAPRASQRRSEAFQDSSQDARNAVRVAKRSRKRLQSDLLTFAVDAPTLRSMKKPRKNCGFQHIGRFSRRAIVERKSIEKTIVSALEIDVRGVLEAV